MVTKQQMQLMQKQNEAQLDAANLRNVELTLYINDLRAQVRKLEDENRKQDSI